MGAWLLVGPYRSATHGLKPMPAGIDPLAASPPGVDESTLRPLLGTVWGPAYVANAAPAWGVATSAEGPIDVRAALHATEGDLIAYAAGTLHVEQPGRYVLLLGVDDGVRVSVDGKVVFARDDPRPERDDDDTLPLDLAQGDHPIVLKLHQRDGAWLFHARILGPNLTVPRGTYLALAGTSVDDVTSLQQKMSWVSVDRVGRVGGHLRRGTANAPTLTVRFAEGAPLGPRLDVQARLLRAPMATVAKSLDPDSLPTWFSVDAGEAAAGGGDLVVDLPELVPKDFPRDEDLTFDVRVAGRVVRVPLFVRPAIRDALTAAARVLRPLEAIAPPWLESGSLETLLLAEDRLRTFASHSDNDIGAQLEEASELRYALTKVAEQKDPYSARTGLFRRAYRSSVDGARSEFGLYVPSTFRRGIPRRFPLIVVLHGLNGRPMAMIRYFFGGDDPKKENDWEDRHPLDPMPPLDAFVVAPSGRGNTMYRDLGEDDVLDVVAWVKAHYPIDDDRVTITGASMGGIGSAAIPLHHPDIFAAAAPLCGYHSYFVRRDVIGRPMRPWERRLAEERSNVSWADNGERLPLWIVHGTLDLPEENSGALIQRYEDLKYSVVHDHPELGHNVWQTTYEEMKGATWLLPHRRNSHPSSIHFRTIRLRDGDDAWLHVDELAQPDDWGEVDARVRAPNAIDVTTRGVSALHVDRDVRRIDPHGALRATIDGTPLQFGEDEPLVAHRESTGWKPGPARHDGLYKHGTLAGPLRDAFHEPLLFVYGASDPTQARANEEVARAWAQIRSGVTVHYPVMSDVEFFAQGEALANARPLFLVGNARSNRVVRAIEPDLPVQVDGDAVVLGGQRFVGSQVGAAFVFPNPKRSDRYVVVVEGADALGTWRSLSLPDLLPDFIVYDVSVAPARGQILLGAGMARAAGFFQNDWTVPVRIADPLAGAPRPSPRTEHEATPYLP